MDKTRAAAGLRASQGNRDVPQHERFRLAVGKLRVRTCVDSTFSTDGPLVQESVADPGIRSGAAHSFLSFLSLVKQKIIVSMSWNFHED